MVQKAWLSKKKKWKAIKNRNWINLEFRLLWFFMDKNLQRQHVFLCHDNNLIADLTKRQKNASYFHSFFSSVHWDTTADAYVLFQSWFCVTVPYINNKEQAITTNKTDAKGRRKKFPLLMVIIFGRWCQNLQEQQSQHTDFFFSNNSKVHICWQNCWLLPTFFCKRHTSSSPLPPPLAAADEMCLRPRAAAVTSDGSGTASANVTQR